jgi:hypothetical protein
LSKDTSESIVAAEVELFLRISNTDALLSIEPTEFRVAVEAYENELRAAASTDKDWARAWERGIEPIRQPALQHMKEDVWNLDATLAEDSHTFQAAMVLLASELVGPYGDRMATFLGYPRSLVQVIAARSMKQGFGNMTRSIVKAGSIPTRGESPSCWMSWSRKVS